MKPSACVCDARSILRLPAHLKHWAIRLCQRRIDHHSCAPPSASVRAWSGSCVFFSAHSQEREHSAVTRALKRHLGSQLKAETLSTFHLSSAVLIKKKKRALAVLRLIAVSQTGAKWSVTNTAERWEKSHVVVHPVGFGNWRPINCTD